MLKHNLSKRKHSTQYIQQVKASFKGIMQTNMHKKPCDLDL